jgi:GNAT superfamily N-acetyltransferase
MNDLPFAYPPPQACLAGTLETQALCIRYTILQILSSDNTRTEKLRKSLEENDLLITVLYRRSAMVADIIEPGILFDEKGSAMPKDITRPTNDDDRVWVSRFIAEHWGAEIVVSRGVVYHPQDLPGFVAIQEGEKVGLVTYNIVGESCGIVTIDSIRPSSGVGTALIEAVRGIAIKSRCKRLWLITTNDNLNALRFYQKRGFVLVAVHRNALDVSRKLKPEIPLIGDDGIPLRDEIELETMLDNTA